MDGKTVREEYLVDADSFTEVETKLVKEFGVSCDDVLSVRRSPISETYHDNDAGDYYRVKLIREYTDDNGHTKASSWYMLLRAVSHEEATNRTLAIIQQGYDMKVSDIVRTKIIALI